MLAASHRRSAGKLALVSFSHPRPTVVTFRGCHDDACEAMLESLISFAQEREVSDKLTDCGPVHTRTRTAHLTMPVPSKAVQQDGNLRDANTYGYDAPSRFNKWALAGLVPPNAQSWLPCAILPFPSYANELSWLRADKTGSGAYTCSFQTGSKIRHEETSSAPSPMSQVALTAPIAGGADEAPSQG